MKKMKKIFAVILSLAMILGMSLTSFAAQVESGVANEKDTAQVKIENISGNATVTLYQVAEGVYGPSGKGLIRYDYFDGFTPLSGQPTSGDINALYQEILNRKSKDNLIADIQSKVNGTYTSKELNAGAYIAIITEADDGTVYNPVLLTVSYNENGVLEGGDVNLTAGYIFGSTAVAKKSTPDVDKEIIDGTTPDGDRDTASVGDVITYQITPTMPSYPENATNKTFFFADTMSKGLTFIFDSLQIAFENDADKAIESTKNPDGTITFTTDREGEEVVIATAKEGNNGFYLNFDYDALVYNSQSELEDDDVDNMAIVINQNVYIPVVKYSAVLNDDAVVGNPGNPNDARMYYSHEPNNGSTFEPTDENPEPNGETPGVTKKEDKEVVYTYQLAFLKTGEGDDAAKLAGAVFGIYTDENCTKLVDVVKTNTDGYAVSSKVSAGEYFIKELVAPEGYHLNDKVYSITANWKSTTTTITTESREWKYTTDKSESEDGVQIGWIDTKGTENTEDDVFYALDEHDGSALLPAYTVYDKTVVTTSSKIETAGEGGGTASSIIDIADGDKQVSSIPNTRLASLPSTGGIGTTIFTVGGCAIMIIAAGLYFASRRKASR